MTKNEVAPIVEEKPRTGDELETMLAEGKIARDEFERVDALRERFTEELEGVLKHARDAERQILEATKALVYGFGADLLNSRIDELKACYVGERPERFLEHVRHHILEHLDIFARKTDEEAGLTALLTSQQDRYLPYRVNLIVDNRATECAPIVVETYPTYKNLFGTVEKVWDRSGQSYTDFTRIKAGSLLRAAGGYLVLSFQDVLSEPGVYQSLKRTLKSGTVDIQGFDPGSLLTGTALKLEPIEVEVKVVLIGDAQMYQLFYQGDPDFKKIFKVKSDFDTVMERDAGIPQALRLFHVASCRGRKPAAVSPIGRGGDRGRGRTTRRKAEQALDEIQRHRGHLAGRPTIGRARRAPRSFVTSTSTAPSRSRSRAATW